MSRNSKLLLAGVLLSWLLAGCAIEDVSYSPSLGFNTSVGSNSFFQPSLELTPYPPPGAYYYSDNWYETGNGHDLGLYSNW